MNLWDKRISIQENYYLFSDYQNILSHSYLAAMNYRLSARKSPVQMMNNTKYCMPWPNPVVQLWFSNVSLGLQIADIQHLISVDFD